ncbi:acid phosphatase [Grosmannia clavigera kw1407]|uniref:Purple acid phosphatase n=1 Tax=Grosmannia clavigera (strain kw1407 / UAMH 11150) TaxID=655863 RepID=F0XBL4_GROCL|nr:acid phosphatase [Grosmannia clavigera kw1407]EFX04943.1 acid phosphatase [Grosmannia clavigera kw1407]
MKTSQALSLAGTALLAATVNGAPTVDTTYPYTGPAIPVADWVDPTISGNGKGFPRLVEAPGVKPSSANPTNNVNVISLSYVPKGMNIHYQTPFGLGVLPSVKWGTSEAALLYTVTGQTHGYDRTPPCSMVAVTQCSQFFHEVQITDLQPDTTYYYQILAANGTTESDVLSFTTARAVGDHKPFSVAVLNDMGYTNAQGTFRHLNLAADDGLAFAWHGGDLSYADDWYSGILPCSDDWPVCYNGTSSSLPPGDYPNSYNEPLPAGEVPGQGGPYGGDMSVLYESNWDLWQQWVQNLTIRLPYMVMPGNHEAACAEFDGPNNELTAYLVDDKANGTAPKSELTYFSCPPSQRNYTAFQHRFRMPGSETGGVGNMWYSFDYGLAHFISLNGETDYAYSPEWPFIRDTDGVATEPRENQTYITDSGPFGYIKDNAYTKTEAYEQYQWLVRDLAAIDRSKTPWVFVMSHRPMYSTAYSSDQLHIRNAFEETLLQYGVDAYLAGHIHWYERMFPMGRNGTIDMASVAANDNNTYYTNTGVSMAHIVNGMAGNIESHSTLADGKVVLNLTAVLDQTHYGFSKLTVHNASVVTWDFVRGDGCGIGDSLTLIKRSNSTNNSTATPSSLGYNATHIASSSSTKSVSTRFPTGVSTTSVSIGSATIATTTPAGTADRATASISTTISGTVAIVTSGSLQQKTSIELASFAVLLCGVWYFT